MCMWIGACYLDTEMHRIFRGLFGFLQNLDIFVDTVYVSGFENMDIEAIYIWFQDMLSRSLHSLI